MDQWFQNQQLPEKRRDTFSASQSNALVELVEGEVALDKWYREISTPVPTSPDNIKYEHLFFVQLFVPPDGNYSYIGDVSLAFSPESTTAADRGYIGNLSLSFSPASDFDPHRQCTGNLSLDFDISSITSFNTGIPYAVMAAVTIDGQSYGSSLVGNVNITREDNAAATFDITISSTAKAASFLNKEVKISFLVSDSAGNTASFTPLVTGLIKRVVNTDGVGMLNLQGYDYSGVHNAPGELLSQDITTVLTGSVFLSGAGSFSTGFAPIWGVNYQGTDDIVDGRDYFVNTLTGTIEVPISSNFVDSPGGLGFSYAVPFDSLKALIADIAARKGWTITEDGISITDYSVPAKQPVVSLSNESVIDAVYKFLELNGAKMESNLFPELRVYSETANFIGADNHVIDESKYYEDSLNFDTNLDDLITKQTVRSVAKTFANIVIGTSETLLEKSGNLRFEVKYVHNGVYADIIVEGIQPRTVQFTISKSNINNVSFSAGGTFGAVFINGVQKVATANIQDSDWTQTIEDNNIVFTLRVMPEVIQISSSMVVMVDREVNWTLIVTGTKINYGEGQIEETVEVTGTRPVTGITEELVGDVYENAYIETAEHAGNLANAILTERGNIYKANFDMPMHKAAAMNIGDKINIEKAAATRFKGVIKQLEYNLNTETAEAPVSVVAKGIGIGI